MSWQATGWAWTRDLSIGEKLLLLCLANYANDERQAYPGQATISKDTGMSTRAIRDNLERLEKRGLISRTPRYRDNGTRTSDLYKLVGLPAESAASNGDYRQNPPRLPADPAADPIRDPLDKKDLDPTDLVREDSDAGPMTPEDLMESWNDFCATRRLPILRALTGSRRKKTMLRLREHPTVEFWSEVLTGIDRSPFLLGLTNNTNGHENWRLTFDFLIDNDTNAVKIVEGKYNEKSATRR